MPVQIFGGGSYLLDTCAVNFLTFDTCSRQLNLFLIGQKCSVSTGGKRSSILNLLKEDDIIINLIAEYGPTKWSVIAKSLPGRIGKQCRERWHNHLNPEIKKDAWTPKQEIELMKAHIKHGNKWAEIAKVIHGRTDNSIKNHWNSSLRKKLDYYLRTGKLPPIQRTDMLNTAQDTGNFGTKKPIYCSNSALERDVHNVPETTCTVSSSLAVESSKMADQHDSVNPLNALVYCHVQVPEIVLLPKKSDSGIKNCNSNEIFSQNEESSETTLRSVPSNVSFLCYKPPQLEDLVNSGSSSPSDFINWKCSGEQSIESFLKGVARSFPNAPSIIKRRGVYTPLPSNGCTPIEENGCDNTERTSLAVSKFLSSPCNSNGDLFANEEDFNFSPPYRIWSKRKANFRSVEKQLDFTMTEGNSDRNDSYSNFAGKRSSYSLKSATVQVLKVQRRTMDENPAGDKERGLSCLTKMGLV